MAKRGLFQSIFGGKSEKNKDFHAYKLLSSWESTFVPYSGNMWDINTVRSAVDAFARRASTAQPRHVRQSAETTVAVNDYIDRILQFRPNPYMTAADFYYKLAAQYKVYNNAIAYPVFDETGRLTAVYPINAQYFELLEYMGTLYCRFTFATGATYICEYSRIIHVRRHFLEHDIFGDGNKPLDTALKTANTLNQSMSKFAELVAVIRGILKVSNAVKTEDLNRRRDDFIRDNLRMENNGAGVIVTDAKYDYTPITDKTTPIPATQLAYVKEEIYDYLGVSKEIVENTATPQQEQAFYSGEIAPFFRRLSQAFSNVLFTEREFGYGNRIVFSANSVQFATLPEKVTAAKFLTEIGAATLDQILTMFDMPTIGGEEGALKGPSMMPGGSPAAWPFVKPIFQAICAKVEDGSPCCDWVGENGAGHFVKMVHNGIEYGDMQLICEAYQLMRDYLRMSDDEMHRVFAAWNETELDSYLIEITRDILAYRDTDGSPLVEHILDTAGQKGTGKWTAVAALDEGVPLTLIGVLPLPVRHEGGAHCGGQCLCPHDPALHRR